MGYPQSVPSFASEDRAEHLKLVSLWSQNGLLELRPGPPPRLGQCRVFGAFEAFDRDRQIGDRRLPNAIEAHINGPSSQLPAGTSLLALELPRHSRTVIAFILIVKISIAKLWSAANGLTQTACRFLSSVMNFAVPVRGGVLIQVLSLPLLTRHSGRCRAPHSRLRAAAPSSEALAFCF